MVRFHSSVVLFSCKQDCPFLRDFFIDILEDGRNEFSINSKLSVMEGIPFSLVCDSYNSSAVMLAPGSHVVYPHTQDITIEGVYVGRGILPSQLLYSFCICYA